MDLEKERSKLYNGALNDISQCMDFIKDNLKGEQYEKASEELKETYMAYRDLQTEWVRNSKVFGKIKQDLAQDPDKCDFDISSMIDKYQREELQREARERNATASEKLDGEVEEACGSDNAIGPIGEAAISNALEKIDGYDMESITALLNSNEISEIKCLFQGNDVAQSSSDVIPDKMPTKDLEETENT